MASRWADGKPESPPPPRGLGINKYQRYEIDFKDKTYKLIQGFLSYRYLYGKNIHPNINRYTTIGSLLKIPDATYPLVHSDIDLVVHRSANVAPIEKMFPPHLAPPAPLVHPFITHTIPNNLDLYIAPGIYVTEGNFDLHAHSVFAHPAALILAEAQPNLPGGMGCVLKDDINVGAVDANAWWPRPMWQTNYNPPNGDPGTAVTHYILDQNPLPALPPLMDPTAPQLVKNYDSRKVNGADSTARIIPAADGVVLNDWSDVHLPGRCRYLMDGLRTNSYMTRHDYDNCNGNPNPAQCRGTENPNYSQPRQDEPALLIDVSRDIETIRDRYN
ncbi:MAG: hypothetical protein HQK53_14215 [Oligoflexia bacterium]|nr:hypothetical protein [Oligoflexia bacterium]